MIEERRILIILLVGILLGGGILYGISQYQAQAWSGKLWFSVTIGYKDGTVQTVNPREKWFGFLGMRPIPLKIIDPATGKEIDWIAFTVYMTPEFTGTVDTATVDISFSAKLDDIVKDSQDIYDHKIYGLKSGEETSVSYMTYYASQIEDWYGIETGKKVLTFEATITLTILFTDGTEDSKTASGSASIEIERIVETGAIQALSIRVGVYMGYK